MNRPEAPQGKRHWSGAEALPGDRYKGDFPLTREIITQPSVDRALAGAGAPYLEKMSEKNLIFGRLRPPMPAPWP